MKDNAFVEITGHFGSEFNLAGFEDMVGKESTISSLRRPPRLTRWPAEGMIPATPVPCVLRSVPVPALDHLRGGGGGRGEGGRGGENAFCPLPQPASLSDAEITLHNLAETTQDVNRM